MASESSDPPPSKDNPQEGDDNIPAETVETPELTGSSPTETESHPSAPTKIPAPREKLTEAANQTPEQSTPFLAKEVTREESPNTITEQDLTDVIVWAVRQLAPIEARLDRYGVFDLVENWLLEQQSDLLWLLARPPQQVLKEIGTIQRQNAAALRKYREYQQQEQIARLTAPLEDQEDNGNE